jgi:hypothetical protein
LFYNSTFTFTPRIGQQGHGRIASATPRWFCIDNIDPTFSANAEQSISSWSGDEIIFHGIKKTRNSKPNKHRTILPGKQQAEERE